MNYQETIDYLYTRLPLFSRIGDAAYKADLQNTIILCSELGDPQNKFRSIHVAGTNGKGSVSHMLAAILQTAGYKTGLYTSPHLHDFRERIKINGEPVSEEFVVSFTEHIIPVIDRIEPSFFEITVAMAFEYFASQQVDIAVVETGLGGRLDSTNVIHPELSVITNIGWDHMNLLGDTLSKIAGEKAGIIKPGIPVIIGEATDETLPVFEQRAQEKKAPISLAAEARQSVEWSWEKHELVVEVAEQHKEDHKKYHLDLAGIYQIKNLLTVLESVGQLQQKGWKIYEEHIRAALPKVKKLTGLYGRWDIIEEHPTIVLDVGHNEDGIRQILRQVELTDHHHLHIVIGMVNDKDHEKVIKLLPPTASYYFTQAKIPRALDANELQTKAAVYGLQGKQYSDVNAALTAAKEHAVKDDLILVCGSVFVVAEVQR